MWMQADPTQVMMFLSTSAVVIYFLGWGC